MAENDSHNALDPQYEPEDFYYTSTSNSSSSSSSSASDSDSEDDDKQPTDELVIYIKIDDKRNVELGELPKFQIRCGTGRNSFRWLAMVAAQRYSQLTQSHGSARVRERYHSLPGQFSPSNVNHLESQTTKSSSLLEGLRRRSMHRHSSAVMRAVANNALKINPRSSLRELLCNGDTVTVVISAIGSAFCEKDGRFVARSQPTVTPFEGAAFHTSPAGQRKHEEFKASIMELEQEERQTRMAFAAGVLFGESAAELTDRDLTREAAVRENLIKNMFVMDWMALDLHGILKIVDRPTVKEVLKEHFGLLLKVFDHFSTIGVDFVFQAVTHSLVDNLKAERCSIWVVDYQKKELWTKVSSGTGGYQLRIPMMTGIIGDCVETGQIINIKNAYQDSRFNAEVDRKTGFTTIQVLCVPAKSSNGRVLGALQIINRAKIKQRMDGSAGESGDTGAESRVAERRKRGTTLLRRRATRKINLGSSKSSGNEEASTFRMVDDLRPFTRAEEIDCEHVAERFGRELKSTKGVEDDGGDGGRTGGMSMPEFHKMCESLGFFDLAAADNVNNRTSNTSTAKPGKLKLTDAKLDQMFNNLITRRDLRQQHSNGNRRKSRATGGGTVHPEALDRQSFLLLIIWIANKAYSNNGTNGSDKVSAAQCLVQLIKEHILPHSKLFAPADIKTIMLEEENAQVLLEHVKILKLLFIRYRDVGEIAVISRVNFLEMCKEVDVYRLGLNHDDVVRIFKISGSDLGGASRFVCFGSVLFCLFVCLLVVVRDTR